MKARRKSDGEIIEVREWRGASDVIYSSPDMNQFYQSSDLDFNLGAESQCLNLSDVKQKIDAWMESHSEEEVYEALKKYGAVEDADTVIQGWVAIDEAYGQCFLHTEKPIQKAQPIADTGDYDTVWDSNGKTYLIDVGLFPDMDSDSDPIKVEIIIKKNKNG